MLKYFTFNRFVKWIFLWIARSFPIPGNKRYIFLKMGGVKFKSRHPKKVAIYENVLFDTVAPHLITIGDNVGITTGCKILTHFIDPSQSGNKFRFGNVVIDNGAFLGVNTIICNSVTIGKGSIVGAGSVVTKDIPPGQVWAGVPARYIKDRQT